MTKRERKYLYEKKQFDRWMRDRETLKLPDSFYDHLFSIKSRLKESVTEYLTAPDHRSYIDEIAFIGLPPSDHAISMSMAVVAAHKYPDRLPALSDCFTRTITKGNILVSDKDTSIPIKVPDGKGGWRTISDNWGNTDQNIKTSL